MGDEEIERRHMPGFWSKRLPSGAVVDEFIRSTVAESQRIQETVPCELRNRYGSNSDRETVDVYGTDLPEGSPIFAYFPGGYWQVCGSADSAYPVGPMHAGGIVSVIVDHDRAPGVTLTEIVQQVIRAAQWILDYAKSRKAKRIVLCGHSAGSHLCAMVVSSSWFSSLDDDDRHLFRAVVHLSGVFGLKPLMQTSIRESLQLTEAETVALSPLEGANVEAAARNCREMRRTSVYVAENEAPAFIAWAAEYAKVLKEQGLANVSHQLVPMVDHFDLVEKLSMERYVITKEIIRLLNEEDE